MPYGRLLVAFADAVLGEDEGALTRAREALAAALGPPGLADAAAVVGLFNAIDRVADATGIPLEPEKAAASYRCGRSGRQLPPRSREAPRGQRASLGRKVSVPASTLQAMRSGRSMAPPSEDVNSGHEPA